MMKYIFWILWVPEAIFALWWFFDGMKYTSTPMNPYTVIGLLWVLVALFVKLYLKSYSAAMVMTAIPGVSLFFYGFFLVSVLIIDKFFGPIRWN